jgi:hypothetical protein
MTPVAFLVACSTSGSGPRNVVNGTIGGTSFTIVNAASALATNPSDGSSGAIIFMSSTPNFCSDIESNILHPNEQLVVIELTDASGATKAAPSVNGDYVIAATSGLLSGWASEVADAQCAVVSGTVTKAARGRP